MPRTLLGVVAVSVALVAGFIGADVRAGEFVPTTQGKKIIAYGADWPNTAYVRANIARMEALPFDGILIAISKSRKPEVHQDTIGIRLFKREKVQPADYEHAIEDLKQTAFRKFTDNFIQIETMPGHADFFDDAEWEILTHNLRAMARVAKQGNLKGLCIDPEEYDDGFIWSPDKWKPERRHGKSERELIEAARRRGEQSMRAINAEYPGVRLLFLMGPSYTDGYMRAGVSHYRLLAPFVEGMCRAADAGTQIIDGYEQSYGYRIAPAFAAGRREILASRRLFADPADFDRVMRVGFGICLEEDSGMGGPAAGDAGISARRWADRINGVNIAMRYTDEYVWTWHGNWNGWEGAYPPEQLEAFAKGRTGGTINSSFPGSILPLDGPITRLAAKAAKQKGADDASTFAAIMKDKDLLLDLPKDKWLFRLDSLDEGVAKGFARERLNISSWKTISIGKFWEEQGWDYDGFAWYRTTFKLDSIPAGKKIYLAVGAADEAATVWVNGREAGGQDLGEAGWDRAFTCEMTGAVRAGENQLAIRVFDRRGPGGLWKSIRILIDK